MIARAPALHIPSRALRTGFAIVLLALVGCAPTPPAPALRIPRAELDSRVGKLCLRPLRIDLPLEGGEERLAAFEALLANTLEELDFSVVRSGETTKLLDEINGREGGYYDRHSGWRDEAKYQTVTRLFLQELKNRLGCDAVLSPQIAIVTASFTNARAEWDGVADWLADDWIPGHVVSGYTPALSLWVSIRDTDDREIYFGTGGIQVAAQLDLGFWSDEFKQVEDAAILSNAERNELAILRSIGPLRDPSTAYAPPVSYRLPKEHEIQSQRLEAPDEAASPEP